ncbi:MAG: hypothetical protein QMD92_00770 [bacterium]|nr:hypothetical protein [bacterium]
MGEIAPIAQNITNVNSVVTANCNKELEAESSSHSHHTHEHKRLHAACCGNCLRANVEREAGIGTGFDRSA